MNSKSKKPILLKWHIVRIGLIAFDIVSIALVYFAVLWMRFDCRYSSIPSEYINLYHKMIIPFAVCCVAIYYILKLYNSIWKFASYKEFERTVIAVMLTTVVLNIFAHTLGFMPISFYFVGVPLQFGVTLGVRFSYRMIRLIGSRKKEDKTSEDEDIYIKRVMIVGAGQAGQFIARDIRMTKQTSEKVCCFIDDNVNKWGRDIDGIKIFGGRDDILNAVSKYHIEKIYVAIPSAAMETKKEILNICKETGCELLSLPGIYQLTSGEVKVSQMKNVAIEDLLGREQIRVNMDEIFEFLKGKVVLITGGGGSIGSELARQVAEHEPKQLILFDVYENNVYDIQLELRKKYPELDLVVLIGSVRDSRKVFDVFKTYHPQVVYHAAAHKHVPLMEDSPCEAIKNNAMGTYKTAFAAMVHGCERFVLISTDKAVNPTNIMGASKRLCEMVIQAFDAKIKAGRAIEIPQMFTHFSDKKTKSEIDDALMQTKTQFVAVRFGNVLGSNGSVIPIFKRQIEAGGPVCVTHPDIIRYFMTIPEAVGLVLQAGTYAKGGEIFVLDMGEPVKIDTLARNLIKLSGLKPGVDIKIEYTGLRPGEKLYEEKLMAEEGLKKTQNDLIHIGCPIPFDVDEFLGKLEELMEVAYRNDEGIREYVMQVVGTYKPV